VRQKCVFLCINYVFFSRILYPILSQKLLLQLPGQYVWRGSDLLIESSLNWTHSLICIWPASICSKNTGCTVASITVDFILVFGDFFEFFIFIFWIFWIELGFFLNFWNWIKNFFIIFFEFLNFWKKIFENLKRNLKFLKLWFEFLNFWLN
jgi:hypothetical protein